MSAMKSKRLLAQRAIAGTVPLQAKTPDDLPGVLSVFV